jgi:acyl-CoA thioester hydrolase
MPESERQGSAMRQTGGPPIIFRTTVVEPWIDYNNHMTEYAYLLVFGKAADAFIQSHGIGRDYRHATGRTIYALTSQISFVREAQLGMELEIDLLLLDAAAEFIHVFQHMYDAGRQLRATYEAVFAHVNQHPQPKVEPFPEEVRLTFERLRREHAAFERPRRAGLPVGIRR